jgi:release factor glutamine methyltransferase
VALTAAGIDNARFEARLLLSVASSRSIEALVAHGRDETPAAVVERLRVLTARRVRREPMAHILGEREFWGLPFKVTPAVLVPRPDSETVIETALILLPDRARAWRILDLGVGSGCLLLSLLSEFKSATGVGMDASPEALEVARTNAGALGLAPRATLVLGDWRVPDWWRALGGPFDLVVANPPYIESAAIDGLMPEVARFDPRLALDGGEDGLAAYRSIASAAHRIITANGWLLAEIGEGQAIDITNIFRSSGLTPETPAKDLGGIERVIPAKH